MKMIALSLKQCGAGMAKVMNVGWVGCGEDI
jgi:hypothetical protein